jgi:dCMP deaminase
MKEKYVSLYMDIAARISQMSFADRLKVGSILVKDNRILSYGWNGTPSGWDNSCEDKEWCSAGGWLSPEEIEEMWPYEGTYIDDDGNEMRGRYRLKTKPQVLHAERNALDKVAASNESSKNSWMFTTHSPCLECAKSIYSSGITRVHYKDHYRTDEGVIFLEKCGVEVKQIK